MSIYEFFSQRYIFMYVYFSNVYCDSLGIYFLFSVTIVIANIQWQSTLVYFGNFCLGGKNNKTCYLNLCFLFVSSPPLHEFGLRGYMCVSVTCFLRFRLGSTSFSDSKQNRGQGKGPKPRKQTGGLELINLTIQREQRKSKWSCDDEEEMKVVTVLWGTVAAGSCVSADCWLRR